MTPSESKAKAAPWNSAESATEEGPRRVSLVSENRDIVVAPLMPHQLHSSSSCDLPVFHTMRTRSETIGNVQAGISLLNRGGKKSTPRKGGRSIFYQGISASALAIANGSSLHRGNRRTPAAQAAKPIQCESCCFKLYKPEGQKLKCGYTQVYTLYTGSSPVCHFCLNSTDNNFGKAIAT
jgi:hypothetical protein